MNILVNKISNLVEGINCPSTPFGYFISVGEDFNPTKYEDIQEGLKQKLNDNNEPLYLKFNYRTETKELIVGKDEVLEDTGVPVIIVVQKTNDTGEKLYLEPLFNEDGEVVDYAEVTKATSEQGFENDPIFVEVHKTSVKGKPLYYKDIIEVVEEQILDYTEEVTEVTEHPIMIPNMVTHTYTLKENFEKFTSEDILEAKYQKLLEDSQCDYLLGDMFLNENDIDLEDEKHSANTGVALLQLLPKGQAKTKSIILAEPTKEFTLLDFEADEGVEIYLSGKKFVNGKLSLTSPISNCTIKFVNTTDKHNIIKSYVIGY